MGVDLTQWTAIQSYMDRIAERPAVIAAMKDEGIVVN
jgi:glutathione S-transferase